MRLSGTFARAMVVAGLLGWAPLASAQTADVTGTVTDKAGNVVDEFAGTFTLSHLEADGDQLVAVGTLTGELTKKNGKTKAITKEVAFPVDPEKSGIGLNDGVSTSARAAVLQCDVLNLVLGPLDLNLLGLEVHLNQVVLDVVANAAGGLLGQILTFLCGLNILGLLDLLGNLAFIADLLNLLFGL